MKYLCGRNPAESAILLDEQRCILESVRTFSSTDAYGRDQGANVRINAEQLVDFVASGKKCGGTVSIRFYVLFIGILLFVSKKLSNVGSNNTLLIDKCLYYILWTCSNVARRVISIYHCKFPCTELFLLINYNYKCS